MSNIILLTKTLLKNGLLSGSNKNSKKQKNDKSKILYFIIIAIYFLIFSVPIIVLLNNVLKEYDFSELLLTIALPVGAITSIVFGVFSITSVFYFNKDSEQLLPFPIKSSELLISKFIVSLLSQYFMLFMFVYPIIFGVGIGINASVVYYLYALSICLLMPLIPSVIVAIIMMVINKIINIGKRKNLFMYSMIVIVLAFSLGYGLGIGSILELDSESLMTLLLNGENTSIINLFKWVFPFFNSATYSLLHSDKFIGFASFMTFIGLNILFMFILYCLGDFLYIKGLTKDSGHKKENSKYEMKKYKFNKGGVLLSLIKKEWVNISRTPIYMLNIVVTNLLVPFILFISFAISNWGQLKTGFNFSLDFNNGGVYLIGVVIIFFLSTMGGTTGSGSAISREGKEAWVMKVVPVDLKTQIDAKIYFYTLIDLIVALAIEALVMIVLKAPWYYLVMVNIPLILMILIINYISVLLDLRRPKLAWSDEAEPLKQNFTVMIGIIISMLMVTILSLLGVLLFISNVNVYLIFLLFTLVVVICYILLVLYIKKNQVKLFNKVG